MFFATPLIGAVALLSGFTAALPRPDSAIGEVAVSSPNGTPMSDTATPAMQTAVTGSSSSQAGTTSAPPATATSSATPSAGWSQSPPKYGSGSSGKGSQDYNNCVQQCVASFGGLSSATQTPPTATSVSSSGSSGSGATHTVIVAPTQGVLRFVPFALNASVGDTIHFMWGANNHTVTKSSSLTPCNKTSDNPFSSGTQNKGFVFKQVVNDTKPTFYYCGTPTHCDKGMFGIINPPNALGSPTSAAGMMQPLASNNSNIAAYAAYTNSQTKGNPAAAGWGGSIDMAALPHWSHSLAAENIMYTRTFLAANREVMQTDGTVNLGSASSTPLMIPKDLNAALSSTGTTTSPATPSVTSSVTPSSSTVASSSLGSSASTSSASISTSSSKVLFGLVVGFATFTLF